MYLAIYKITRHLISFWSASIMIDYNPHAYVDTENLAETFISRSNLLD